MIIKSNVDIPKYFVPLYTEAIVSILKENMKETTYYHRVLALAGSHLFMKFEITETTITLQEIYEGPEIIL